MARELETNHEASIEHGTGRTTVQIQLSTGEWLRYANSDFIIEDGEDELEFAGKFKALDALTMDLTPAVDGMRFQISNVNLILGQLLINTPYALDGMFCIIGSYFRNNETLEEWHEEKIVGEIVTGDIDRDSIECEFVSDLDAAEYNGNTIASVFPDAQLELSAAPPPVNDIIGGGGALIGRMQPIDGYNALWEGFQGIGRYELPRESFFIPIEYDTGTILR